MNDRQTQNFWPPLVAFRLDAWFESRRGGVISAKELAE